MNNDIIDFLNLNDNTIVIKDFFIDGDTKVIVLEKILEPIYCPLCSFKMHSKGIHVRKIKHPILQDGYKVLLHVRQRRWKCTNMECNHEYNDFFSFVGKYKQVTNLIPYAICFAMKDLSLSARCIAERFNVSDTTVHNYFMQYVDIPRLPLSEVISIDEVYLNIDNKHKYALVIMDFETKNIIDILPSRLQEEVNKYFLSIPLEERNKVKHIISDMYNPYLQYPYSYFHNSQSVIDSFHVLSWLTNKLNLYINHVKKRYQERDREELARKNYRTNRDWQTTIDSKEVFILKNYKWVLLKNQEDINYSTQRHYVSKLSSYLDTYQIEEKFFNLDKHFKPLRDLKELYVTFNSRNLGNEENAAIELKELINVYTSSNEPIFIEFAKLLEKFYAPIVRSFKIIKSYDDRGNEIIRRISNGPMESFNRKPKDLKRNSRGFSSFEYTRSRILWSVRENEPILACPKPLYEVKHPTGYKRGSYKKNK